MVNKKILVVEDDELMLHLIKFKLEDQNFEVTTASEGKAGKELLISEDFDLVISDIMMPFLSGLELCTLIKTELKKSIPIILLSASGQENTIVEAFEKGADDFISKPISPTELIIRVKKLLK